MLIGADRYETDAERKANRQRGLPESPVGEDTVIEYAILDKDCRIGRNVQIVNRRKVQEEEAEQLRHPRRHRHHPARHLHSRRNRHLGVRGQGSGVSEEGVRGSAKKGSGVRGQGLARQERSDSADIRAVRRRLLTPDP